MGIFLSSVDYGPCLAPRFCTDIITKGGGLVSLEEECKSVLQIYFHCQEKNSKSMVA
jgi:hypothetical protein